MNSVPCARFKRPIMPKMRVKPAAIRNSMTPELHAVQRLLQQQRHLAHRTGLPMRSDQTSGLVHLAFGGRRGRQLLDLCGDRLQHRLAVGAFHDLLKIEVLQRKLVGREGEAAATEGKSALRSAARMSSLRLMSPPTARTALSISMMAS